MTRPAHHDDRLDLETSIAALEQVLGDLLEGRGMPMLDEATCSPAALPLAHTVNQFVRMLREIRDFVVPLSRGDLAAPRPSPENRLAGPLVEMHSRIRQLTRQAQEIARGDFSQRIGAGGEFSTAFNSMVTQIEERERRLNDEIARRAQAEAELQRERDLLAAGPAVTFRWNVDRNGTVSYVSPNVILFGYAPEDFTSGRRAYAGIVDPEDFARIDEESRDKARSGLESWTQEYRILDAGGETRWVSDLTHPVRDKDGAVTAYEGYVIDITAQKTAEAVLRKREEQLRGLSLSDELTGLHNRRGLFALGEHALCVARRRGHGLGVICVDVRGLDSINQRFGHAQGDEALRVVAAALRGSVRESDVVGRVGGDEFVVLVEDGPGVTADVAARIRRRVERAGRDGHPFAVGVSLGATDWRPGDGAGLQELIERAQQLRNDDKRAGRR